MRKCSAAAAVWLAIGSAGVAMDATLDLRGINEAVSLGQSRSDRDRARFHAPYRLAVNRAPVDYLEVVTPFRRIVLEAESRAQTGDRSFGQRHAREILAATPPTLEVFVELTFHPLHTFVGVPDYAIALVEAGLPRIRPRETARIPRHGPRLDGTPLPGPNTLVLPGSDQPMIGGTIVARFDAQTLRRSGIYDVIVEDAGKELARARAEFSRLR
jgi:hypothetical protein